MEFPWAVFGENLTTEGLREDVRDIGDRFRIGTAEFIVTQPRMPCFKLGIRFGRMDMLKRMLRERPDRVLLRGDDRGRGRRGDAIERVHEEPTSTTVTDLVRLSVAPSIDTDVLRRAVVTPGLAEVWREEFRQRLEEQAER